MSEEKNKAFEKLTPERKALVETILQNLENGDGLWKQGWVNTGVPESAITGKQYHGINNFYLTLISIIKGYSDNRWLTYKQMEDKGWSFKTDEEGKSLGRGAGVAIEFFELRDRETRKPFDRSVLDGMNNDERQEYIDTNVYPVRKYYRVFNGDIIEGIPEREKREIDPKGINERAENVLSYWNENEAKIIYGGRSAFYRPSTDEIHLPKREMFYDMPEFYATALHEVGHSTGHKTRLDRDLSGGFGTPDYATEELRAEIASLFMEQDLEIQVSEKHVENNSKYIKAWHEKIAEDPNVLFTAIADADRIAKYVIEKEKKEQSRKNTEYYAIIKEETATGDMGYKVYGVMAYGQVRPLINYEFKSLEALQAEFDNFKQAPFYADKTFEEVTYDELENISKATYEKEQAEAQKEGRDPYLPPSVIAAMGVEAIQEKPVDMSGRGIESLTKMSDRDVVENASKTKNGDKFTKLYNGESVLSNVEKDERSLMTRLAMFCNGDNEQLLRVFRSSGQFRDGKPNGYYEEMAKQSMQFVKRIRSREENPAPVKSGKGRFGMNAKT